MLFYKRLLMLIMIVFDLQFARMGCHVAEKTEDDQQQSMEISINPASYILKSDPVLNLLGRSFEKIEQEMGEPDQQGYSECLGPHNYMLYQQKEGAIRFCSPKNLENKIVVSIIVEPGRDILGVNAGMTFAEIINILGQPDFGSEKGMDNLCYMDYFFKETNQDIPEAYVSFIATGIDSPTDYVFIKWGDFEYEQDGIVAGSK